uniref:Peptidase A1 domain-containing protein n=1 Tax=Opuntia streptacantha TaxID=393608 RepID=A0A7C8ZWW6_OPUST
MKSRRGNSLEVRHRHGPCSALQSEESRRPSHEEILEQDEARVEAIKGRVKPGLTSSMVKTDRIRQKAVGLPAKPGSTIGSGNYIVTVGLGTPKKDLSLIFDTGTYSYSVIIQFIHPYYALENKINICLLAPHIIRESTSI